MASKLTTWTVSNAVPTLHKKASAPGDIALTVTGDSIVKNGKPATGRVINLTIAHMQSEGFAYTYDVEARTFTIKRSEGNRGRKPRTADSPEELSAFVAALTK